MDTVQTALPRLTVSSVGDLMGGCSKKYHELRVLKRWPKGRKMPASVPRGSAIHETLRTLHLHRFNGELPMGDLPTLARDAVWAARYDRDVDRNDEAKRVEAAVRLFCANQDPEDIADGVILALETQIEFDYVFQGVPLVCISATIDRALCRPCPPEAPRRLVLQDYKSTSQRVDLKECFLLLWSARRRWPDFDEYALELIWIDTEENQVSVDVVEGHHVRGQLKILTTALLKVLYTDPVAVAGPSCTFCPIRPQCQGLSSVEILDGEDVF